MKIQLDQVASVYSGRANACCCGCAGHHRYASAHREWASQHRGYTITDDEVSDRSIKIIVRKVQEAIDMGVPVLGSETDFLSVDVGNRMLTVYFVQPK